MVDSLKQRAVKGVAWSAVERFSVQGVQFVLSIIIARLVAPSEYGLIAMLGIFLSVAQAFIDSGFSSALIQKKDRTDVDFSTVFYFNIIVSLIVYLILYFSAPYIALFYKEPLLDVVTKWTGLNIIISALCIIQRVKLTVWLNFKTQAKASLIAVVISGVCGIVLAYYGYGIWALVFQSLLNNMLNTLLLFFFTRWMPKLVFSWRSFRQLFAFGSKLLVTGLYGPVYDNLNVLLIGKFYSSVDLGFYSRATTFAQFPSSNITGIISRVSFPLLAEFQDDDNRLALAYRKLIKISSFIVFPLMLFLGAIAAPLIEILLTSKWIPSAFYLRLLCFSLMWYPICAFNINLLLVKGLSHTHLKLDILKKIVGLIILLFTSIISIEAICIGLIFSSLFSWYVTAYYAGKIIGLSFYRQLKDILPSLLISVFISCMIFYINSLNLSSYTTLVLDSVISIVSYISLSRIFNCEDFHIVLKLIRNRNL